MIYSAYFTGDDDGASRPQMSHAAAVAVTARAAARAASEANVQQITCGA